MNDGFARRWRRFVGVAEPPTIEMRTFETAEYNASRLQWEAVDGGHPVRFDRADGYLLCIQRRDLPGAPYWIDGRPSQLPPLLKGQSLLLNLSEEHSSISRGTVDCLSIFISGAVLQRFQEEHDLRPVGGLAAPRARTIDDVVARNLAECLLPAIEAPSSANKLFVDQIGLALLSHLLEAFGNDPVAAVRPVRGGLAPWQERRAKEMLLAHMDGGIGLEALADGCGLSRSHFARAFKATVGVSPLKWLTERKVERAKDLLLSTAWPLEKIAHACGFTDQSHFSRTFSAHVKISPGVWRRLRRL